MNPIAIVLIVIALIGIGVLVSAVKIVRPYQRGWSNVSASTRPRAIRAST
jgi:regulator of protease activity HflC (stomatin/prohibitin superfamily)